MKSSLSAQLGPRVRIRAIDRVNSASSADVVLRPERPLTATVTLARALIRRGVKASVARHVAETLAAGEAAFIHLPNDDGEPLRGDLAQLGVVASPPSRLDGGSVAQVRRRLNLSQEQFANSVGLDVRTVQNWEQKRGALDGPAALLVKVIDRYPRLVQRVAADDAVEGRDVAPVEGRTQ
jgi:putative transcriptional regulator